MIGIFLPYFDWSIIVFNYFDQLSFLFETVDFLQSHVSQNLKFMHEKSLADSSDLWIALSLESGLSTNKLSHYCLCQDVSIYPSLVVFCLHGRVPRSEEAETHQDQT